MSRSLRSWCLALGLLGALACGPTPPALAPQPGSSAAPSASASAPPALAAAEPPVPMPTLRTGAIAPIEHADPLVGKVVARDVVADAEILGVDLPLELQPQGVVATVGASQGSPRPLAFVYPVAVARGPARVVLWVRRPKAAAGEPVRGDLYLPADLNGYARFDAGRGAAGPRPGEHYRFSAEPAPKLAPDPKLRAQWAEALATELRGEASFGWGSLGPWRAFAAERVRSLYGEKPKQATGRPPVRPPRRPAPEVAPHSDELSELMETTTGASSIQEALQTHRQVFVAAAGQPRSVPLAGVTGPKLAPHPFAQMLATLRKPVPDEPLARVTPAEFYYLRFSGIELLFRTLDELDAWATPASNLLDRRASDRALGPRYEAELGLGRGPLSRALGPEVVDSLAVVGSDPYLREGTDLTLVFRVKSHPLFDAGVAAALAAHADKHGTLKRSSASYEGETITSMESADGAVKQQRAKSGELELVSNSPAAIRRVLDTIHGKRPRLADEPDFRYMLARDTDPERGMLGFAGDRFVAEVIGPAQKILEARRQLALAELLTPGYAALLYGWLNGQSPPSGDELVRSGLLGRSELAHAGGEAIRWQPGQAARSSWGTPAALTPLIDLPAPTMVTAAERDGYLAFARGYQHNWSTYIDPTLLRLGLSATAPASIDVHLRTMPLIEGTEYREIAHAVGDARVDASPLDSGFRAVLGIGREAGLRRDLRDLMGELHLPGGHRIEIDWLGEWALIGVADDPSIAAAVHDIEHHDVPERPRLASEPEPEQPDEIATIARMPFYAAVELRNAAAASVALLAARAMAESALPGMVSWGEAERYREVSIVRVGIRPEASGHRHHGSGAKQEREVELYYAMCEGALLLTLQPRTMRWLVDRRLDHDEPHKAAADPTHSQLLVDLAGTERGALFTVLSWQLEQQALETATRSRADAEVVLRGAPELAGNGEAIRALSLATLGAAPLTPDGQSYELAPSGVRDPSRGDLFAPMWPALPVAGSPAAKLLGALASFRSELSFDDEGKTAAGERMQSLRVNLRLGLRR